MHIANYERISDYWDNYQKFDIENWADFELKRQGVTPAFVVANNS